MDYFKDLYYLIALAIPDGGTLKAWKLVCKAFRDMQLDHLIEKYVDIKYTFAHYQYNRKSTSQFIKAITREHVIAATEYTSRMLRVLNNFTFKLSEVRHMSLMTNPDFANEIIHNPGLNFPDVVKLMTVYNINKYPTSNPNVTIDDLLTLKLYGKDKINITGKDIKRNHNLRDVQKILLYFPGKIYISIDTLCKYFQSIPDILYIHNYMSTSDPDMLSEYWRKLSSTKINGIDQHPEFLLSTKLP